MNKYMILKKKSRWKSEKYLELSGYKNKMHQKI